MADVWVVNASPLISLARAGHLELLSKLPDELVVPEAVADEILAGPADAAHHALGRGWGTRRTCSIPERVAEWSLGAGESAVIALALREAGTAVLDDKNARRCARSLGVPVVGTFGVIVRAKQHGLVPAARPVFQALVEAGLFHDDAVVAALLRAVGEPWP